MPDHRATGVLAEEAAVRCLEHAGYTIVARNFAVPRVGELDIVAVRDGRVHFVEVRARRKNSPYGTGAESITAAKIRKIRHTAEIYLDRMQYLNNEVTLLAADVELDTVGKVERIHWIPIQ